MKTFAWGLYDSSVARDFHQCVGAGLRDHAILLRRSAAAADGADDLPVRYKRQAALHGYGARKLEDGGAASRDSIFEDFGGALEGDRAMRLLLRHLDAADLCLVHALQVNQIAAVVKDGDHHGELGAGRLLL